MAGSIFAPNPYNDTTSGVPYSSTYSGPRYTTRTQNGITTTAYQNSNRFYNTHGGPVTLPSDWSDQDAQQWVDAYNQYIDRLTQQAAQTEGLQRQQILAQIEDAKRARDNELQIAQLNRDTQRYGYDQQRQTALDQLRENQRQFNASHQLEMQKLGLDRAKTATDYLSTPDRYVQAGDYLNLSGRILAGQSGTGNGSGFTPQQKTMSDYANLENGGNSDRQLSASSATAAAAGPGSGADARVKALKAVIDAAPPSDSQGMDDNSYHVLNAAKAIYSLGNLTPQQQATISSNKQYQQMLGSGLSRAGVNSDDWWQRQQSSLPGQRSVRSAY